MRIKEEHKTPQENLLNTFYVFTTLISVGFFLFVFICSTQNLLKRFSIFALDGGDFRDDLSEC